MDQLKVLLFNSKIDVLTISETWLRAHLRTGVYELNGFTSFRQDRGTSAKKGKRGGGLITYINNKHSSFCESLEDLNASTEHIEAQWVLIHRPHCKNVVICNAYRPPNGNLKKALLYLDESLKQINLSKVDVFLLGDMNVNYQNKTSVNYKSLRFFSQSNGLTQHISTTTRNTDRSNALIDLTLSNSKLISSAGTLNHYISDHQPIYAIHKKSRDSRGTAKFEGRSYRNFDKQKFRESLGSIDWDECYSKPRIGMGFCFGQCHADLK